ncbi:MAG: DRTGG domain-containing protein [Dehalococcoidia bacterium]
MPVIVVTSADQGSGKTAVAAAIARHAAFRGTPVRLARVASAEAQSNASADAAWFASLFFAPGSANVPADASVLTSAPEDLLVVEADASAIPESFSGPVVLVRGAGSAAASPAGIPPSATVVTRVSGLNGAAVADGPVISLGEDAVLNGFSVAEARDLLHADVLVPGDDEDTTCDRIVIAPIASDAGQPYFKRFESKAVVARFDKTDMHLAAMQTRPGVLILSGGRRPSEYLFDAAGAQGIPVLLSRTDTENTVIALERIFERTRFQGERKLDRIAALLATTTLFEALGL